MSPLKLEFNFENFRMIILILMGQKGETDRL